jgi:hypothetical protein
MRTLVRIQFLILITLLFTNFAAAQSLSDKGLLWTDPAFQRRVSSAMITAAINISSDGLSAGINAKRHAQVQAIMTSPAYWTLLFSQAVATDPTVSSQATTGGTIVLTTANLATQAALTTDTAINTAVAAQYNSFFGGQ